jgi:transcriptional regulator with XRE-family HTH domain
MPREKTLSSPDYWFVKAQNELFRQFHYYMEEEKINQTQLAERLGISKGRVSQILRGESNFTMKKLIELSLSIRKIAKINYIPVEEEIKQDALKRLDIMNAKGIISNLLEKKTAIDIEWKSVIKDSPISMHTTCGGISDNILSAEQSGTVLYSLHFQKELASS